MSIRKGIEDNLCATLRNLLGSAATVSGFLETAAEGIVRNVPSGKPEVRVRVSPPRAASWASPISEIECFLNVRLDLEDDATQSAFAAVCDPIEELISTWNIDANWSEVSNALGTSRFRVDGFRSDGGTDAIGLTSGDPYIATTFAFTLMGIIQPATPTTNEETNNG